MIRGVINKFNRGEIDQRALGREDIKRVNNSASSMVNFIPSRLGNMQYRPGTEYITPIDSTYDHRLIPFVAATDDTALLDFYNNELNIIVNDSLVTVSSVTTTITNGAFTTDLSGWTDASTGSASTAWTVDESGAAALTGDGTSSAVLYQVIASVDTGTEHFINITLSRGATKVKIGDGGSENNILDTELKTGVHILAFTPTSANLRIAFENSKKYRTLVEGVAFSSASGNMLFNTSLTSATLDSLRVVQSADIIFCTYEGDSPFQIEHRGDKSWSVVDYISDDGPFQAINNTAITLTPASAVGDTTLTASEDYFTSDNVGQLFKLISDGQSVISNISVDTGAGTNSIRVTGVESGRIFTVFTSGQTTSTVTLQRSADNSNWTDVEDYTADQNKSFDDTYDNSIFYYRLYVKAGDNPLPDTIQLILVYAAGSIEGVCRVTAITSATVADIQVLEDFGDNAATRDWYAGSWKGGSYPSTVEIAEGRLWFGGDEEMWGSVSDAYYSFDRGIEGDSASILRTIGFGPVDPIKWIKSAGQLIFGTSGDELVLRSSSYGEVLSQTNANIRAGSTQGSANIEPVKINGAIYFVQRSGNRVFSLANASNQDSFTTVDATLLNQTICAAGVHRIARTMQPDPRVYVVLDDGSMAVYTVDPAEEVTAWSRLTMSDSIKDVVTLPGVDEDRVYVVVERGSSTYLEKFAKFSDAEGGDTSETFDSFLRYTSPGTSIAMAHIADGETVGVWADGQDRGTYVIASGAITVASSWTNVIVGLPYVADYVSNKISGYDKYTALTERKKIVDTGLVLMNYWPGSLKVGSTSTTMKDLPLIENGKAVDQTVTIADYSELPFEFDSDTETDPRIHMQATGPCNILALTYGIDGERSDTGS